MVCAYRNNVPLINVANSYKEFVFLLHNFIKVKILIMYYLKLFYNI